MKTNFARREFLRRSALTIGGLGVSSAVFESIIAQFFARAVAQTLSKEINPSGYYIHMSLPGGPPRWCFDLPLAPMGVSTSTFVQGNFGTRIEKVGSEFKSIYSVDKHVIGNKTVYLPPVWKYGLVKHRFTEILPHTAFIRGMDMEINNHNLSNARQTAPTIGGISLNGVVADAARRPIPCVVDTTSFSGRGFRSVKGFSSSALNYTESATINPVSSLLTPFKNFMAGRFVHSPQANALQEQAFKEFEKYATARGVASSSLTDMYDNAMQLIEENIFSLSAKWPNTVAKYRAIVGEALSPKKGTLPGLFDLAITSQSSALFVTDRLGNKLRLTDARDMLGSTTKAPQMAENFAIAEILLDNVTSTMNLSFRGLSGVQRGGSVFDLIHDQHDIGSLVSTLGTTIFYRALLGCMTEFVDVLKDQKIFDRTVIHISSEFNRTPRIDGSGSDHGFMASNATLISGMIKQNEVIGNIQKADYDTVYKGTFGVARPYVLDGFNRPIQVNDVARTISAMLGVDDIVTNGRSLLAPKGGVWSVRKAEANNV